MLQHTLPLGFVGQAGYVATRTIRQLGQHNINTQQVGGGLASAPLNQKFGRVGSTQYIGPIGGSHYDSAQAHARPPLRARLPDEPGLHLLEGDRRGAGE